MPRKRQQNHRPLDEKEITKLLRMRLEQSMPSAQFKDALYGRLIRQRIARAPERTLLLSIGGIFSRMTGALVACLIILVASGITTTYAYISPSVTRESSLYALKLIVERAELSLSSKPEDRARSLLRFAGRRIDELETLASRNEIDDETLGAVVEYTQKALALADEENDATIQADIRALVASEAQEQRAALEAILSHLGTPVAQQELPPNEEPDTEGEGEVDVETTSVVTNAKPQDISAYEKTISKVGSVEVQALETAATQPSNQTDSQPLDLILTPLSGSMDMDLGDSILLPLSVKSRNGTLMNHAKIAIEWGDGTVSRKELTNLTNETSWEGDVSHTYKIPGTFVIRVSLSAPAGFSEWTTANNRTSMTVHVAGSLPACEPFATRCEDDHLIQRCTPEDGVYAWKRDKYCIDGEQCSNGKCIDPACVSTCQNEGESRCSGTTKEICIEAKGCLQWKTSEICNGTCSNGACSTTTQAVCGDGKVTAPEECDDGNTQNGDGCSSSCKKEAGCTDDDGGYILTKQGTARNKYDAETDFCEDRNSLIEFTCSSANTPFANRFVCPRGCANGACIDGIAVCGDGKVEEREQCDDGNRANGDGCATDCQLEKKCSDSDGGINANERGSAEFTGSKHTDYCQNSSMLVEYSCKSDYSITSTNVGCWYGCSNGACLPKPVSLCGNGIVENKEQCDDGNTISKDGCSSSCIIESVCNDSDGGSVPTLKGTVSQGPLSLADTCTSTSFLREYSCASKYEYVYSTIPCAYGCLNGACAPAPAPVCGNGILETGEHCDDGNTTSGDGCSSVCEAEQSLDLSVEEIEYVRRAYSSTTDIVTLSVKVTNKGPNFPQKVITATLTSGATDEYPSGFSWSGEANVGLGTNTSVLIHLNGQYEVATGKALNLPISISANFKIPTPDLTPSNNTKTFSIVADRAIEPCTDTDGGQNYAQKGTISFLLIGDRAYPPSSDVCLKDSNQGAGIDPNVLIETYCDASGMGRTLNYTCANGCSNGACVPAP